MTLDRMKDLLSPSEEERMLSTLLVVSLHMHFQSISLGHILVVISQLVNGMMVGTFLVARSFS